MCQNNPSKRVRIENANEEGGVKDCIQSIKSQYLTNLKQ